MPAEAPSRTDTLSTSHSPGATAYPVYPSAASAPATASRAGTPRRRISGPTNAVTRTDPAVAMSRIRPRAPTGALKVARIDGQAVPSMPSGIPRSTKLPRLSTSTRRTRRRCSPIGPYIRTGAGAALTGLGVSLRHGGPVEDPPGGGGHDDRDREPGPERSGDPE